MIDYESMSDFEVNRKVATLLGMTEWSEQWLDLPDRDENVILVASNYSREVLSKDFCNSPSDAWPIIVENLIWVQPPVVGDEWFCYDSEDTATASNKNPLRAAMICFLKMKDAEQ